MLQSTAMIKPLKKDESVILGNDISNTISKDGRESQLVKIKWLWNCSSFPIYAWEYVMQDANRGR